MQVEDYSTPSVPLVLLYCRGLQFYTVGITMQKYLRRTDREIKYGGTVLCEGTRTEVMLYEVLPEV